MGLRFSNIAKKDHSIYFIPGTLSALVRYDINSRRSEIVTGFPDYSLFDLLKLGPICVVQNYIIIAPIYGDRIYVYNTDEKAFDTIQMYDQDLSDAKYRYIGKQMLFRDSVVVGNHVYLVGGAYPGLVKIDLEQNKAFITDFDITQLNQISSSEQMYLGCKVSVIKDKIYIPIVNTNFMVVYDTKIDCYDIVELPVDSCVIANCQVNEELFLIPQIEGDLYRIVLEDKQYSLINQYPTDFLGLKDERWFCCGVTHKDELWLFPFQSNMVLKFNTRTGEMNCVIKYDESQKIKYINAGSYDEDKVWGFNSCDNCIDLINCVTGEVEKLTIDIPFNMDDYCLLEKKNQIVGKSIPEEFFNLETLVTYLSKDQEVEEEDTVHSCNGEVIWNKLLEEIKQGD